MGKHTSGKLLDSRRSHVHNILDAYSTEVP